MVQSSTISSHYNVPCSMFKGAHETCEYLCNLLLVNRSNFRVASFGPLNYLASSTSFYLYHALFQLTTGVHFQGVCIPQLYGIGADFMGNLAILVMQHTGSPLQTFLRNKGIKSKTLDALRRIHQLGVCHGDATVSNITGRQIGADIDIFFVDFGNAALCDDTHTLERESKSLEYELSSMGFN